MLNQLAYAAKSCEALKVVELYGAVPEMEQHFFCFVRSDKNESDLPTLSFKPAFTLKVNRCLTPKKNHHEDNFYLSRAINRRICFFAI